MQNTLILGVIGADPHIIGNRILAYSLEHAGFNVVNLGAMVEADEFIKAAIETDAQAILIGSLSGDAAVYVEDFRMRCVEFGLKDILLYLGGHVVMGIQEWLEVEEQFTRMGFDKVYPPGTLPIQVIEDLKKDLGAERG